MTENKPDLAAAPGGDYEPDPDLTDAENEGLRLGTHYIAADCSVRPKPSPDLAAAPGGGRRRFIVEVDEQTTMAQVRDHLDMIDQGGASVWYAPTPAAETAPGAGLVEALKLIAEWSTDHHSRVTARAALSRAGEQT